MKLDDIKNNLEWVAMAYGIVVLVAFFFVCVPNTLAYTEEIFLYNDGGSGYLPNYGGINVTNNYWYTQQSFTTNSTTTNISSVEFEARKKLIKCGADTDVVLALCSGATPGSDYLLADNEFADYNFPCNGNTPVYGEVIFTANDMATTSWGWWKAVVSNDLGQPISVSPSTQYYWDIKTYHIDTDPGDDSCITMTWDNSNPITTGQMYGSSVVDLSMKIYKYSDYIEATTTEIEIIDIGAETEDVPVYVIGEEGSLDFDSPDFEVQTNPIRCVKGIDCIIPYRYNDLAVDYSIIFFTPLDDPDHRTLNYTLLETSIHWKGFLPVDPPTFTSTSTTEDYCGALTKYMGSDFSALQKLKCGYSITWFQDEDALAEALGVPTTESYDYKMLHACDDVATTTTGWFEWDDGLVQSIECAYRKVVVWATTPINSTRVQFAEDIETMKQQFPVSVIAQLYSFTTDISTSSTQGIPLKWWNGSTYEDQGVDLLSSSTIQQGLSATLSTGETLYDFYMRWATNFIYLMVFLYIMARIFNIINPTFTAKFPLTRSDRKADGIGLNRSTKIRADVDKDYYREQKVQVHNKRPSPHIVNLKR